MARPMNTFLLGLADTSYEALAAHLSPVHCGRQEVVYGPGETVKWVYFPETVLLSVVAIDAGGRMVETGMIGREGCCGLIEACAQRPCEFTCLAQIDGVAWRAPAEPFRQLVETDLELNHSAWTLMGLQIAEARRCQLCLALHQAEARLARWLLESDERCGGRNPLPLTQEVLAAFLGVQRSTVNPIAGKLQRRGLIQFARGRIEILQRPGLERLACECYAANRVEPLESDLTSAADRIASI